MLLLLPGNNYQLGFKPILLPFLKSELSETQMSSKLFQKIEQTIFNIFNLDQDKFTDNLLAIFTLKMPNFSKIT